MLSNDYYLHHVMASFIGDKSLRRDRKQNDRAGSVCSTEAPTDGETVRSSTNYRTVIVEHVFVYNPSTTGHTIWCSGKFETDTTTTTTTKYLYSAYL